MCFVAIKNGPPAGRRRRTVSLCFFAEGKRGRFAYIHAAAGPFYLLNVGNWHTRKENAKRAPD